MASKPLPSISLAKRQAKEGSREWLEKVTHEHSKTSPQLLERRRLGLSAHMTTIERAIRNVQLQKKVVISNHNKTLEAVAKERDLARERFDGDMKAFDAETTRILSEARSIFDLQIMEYEVKIAQLVGDLANIEGHCLTIDCLSVRHDVKPKGKKLQWGKRRWSIATFISEMGLHIFETNVMIKELFKTQMDAEALERVEKEVASDVEDDVDDGEVVTEDEEEELKGEGKKEDADAK